MKAVWLIFGSIILCFGLIGFWFQIEFFVLHGGQLKGNVNLSEVCIAFILPTLALLVGICSCSWSILVDINFSTLTKKFIVYLSFIMLLVAIFVSLVSFTCHFYYSGL
jgi:hypothetical protein